MNWVVTDPFESRHDQITGFIQDGVKYFAEYKNGQDINFGLLPDINNENFVGCHYISLAKLAGAHHLFSGATVFLILSNSLIQDDTGLAIGILNGNIVIDTVVDSESVNKKLEEFNNLCERSAKTLEMQGDYPHVLRDYDVPYTLADLIGNKSINRKCYVKPLKSNRTFLRVMAFVVVILIIMTVNFAWRWNDERKKTVMESFRNSQSTPDVQYQAVAIGFLSKKHYVANTTFKQIKTQVNEIPARFYGWKLRSITCQLPSCKFVWTSTGGTFDDFKKNAPEKWVNISPAIGTSLIGDLKTLTHTYELNLDPSELPPKDQWPKSSDFAWNLGNLWQKMTSVGWAGTLSSATLQEVPPGVPVDAIRDSPNAIWGIPWTINNQPFWLIDGLGEFSGNMVLRNLEISMENAKEVALFNATGMAYVKE
jgi:hypothetical protein